MGVQKDPRSLNRYAYAANEPLTRLDRSGRMTTQELGESAAVEGELGGIIGSNVGVQANYANGKAAEVVVKTFLDRFTAQYGGQVF
jgi:hypothetical protein